MSRCTLPHPPTLVLAALLLVVPSTLGAVDIFVPGDFPTIQGAITAANPGDTVLVAPGVYLERIDFEGKAITVRSTDGPATTIIDGQSGGTVVTFASGETAQSILEGFTIEDGQLFGVDSSVGGAGIFVSSAAPTIRGNMIRDNTASWRGAGIYCVDSNAQIIRNEFTGNSFLAPVADIPYGLGGGICVSGGSVEITGNRFSNNFAGDRGGAIFLENTLGSTVLSNVCHDNEGGYGGAIAIGGVSNVTVENLLAVGNRSIGYSTLAGPSPGRGGAVHLADASSVTLRGLTLIGNTAVDAAGVLGGPGEGGGVFSETTMATPPLLRDAIVRGNIASGSFPQVDPSVSVDHSNIEGGFPGGTNIIDVDPLFVVGPEGDFYLSQLATGQGIDSPCVDSGNPMSQTFPNTTTRIDGVPDLGVVDMGFHFPIGPGTRFLRGDCNNDVTRDIADAIRILDLLFPGPTSPFDWCAAWSDFNVEMISLV